MREAVEKKLAESDALLKKTMNALLRLLRRVLVMGIRQVKALNGDLNCSRCSLHMTVVDGKLVPRRQATTSASVAAPSSPVPSEAASIAAPLVIHAPPPLATEEVQEAPASEDPEAHP